MKKVAFLGGSFDPPHIGHVINIFEVLNSKMVEEVWILPAGVHIEKKLILSKEEREHLVKLMIEENFQNYPVVLETEDLMSEKPLSSFEIFGRLRKKYPDIDFHMIIGQDILGCIENWYQGKELLETGKFIVVPRVGFKLKNNLKGKFLYLPEEELVQTNISSTEIRKRLQNKEAIDALVSRKVHNYIKEKELYVKER